MNRDALCGGTSPIRINGKLYVTCEGSDKEISYSNNSCTLYAVYDYGGDAR